MVALSDIEALRLVLIERQILLSNLVNPSVSEALEKNKKYVDQQAQLEYSQIKKALARIEAGTYGQCVVCGEMIDGLRLKAYPHTAFCRSCVSP